MFQIVPFDPSKKKKKKKVVIQDPADDPVDKLAEKTENLSGMQFSSLCNLFLLSLEIEWQNILQDDWNDSLFCNFYNMRTQEFG